MLLLALLCVHFVAAASNYEGTLDADYAYVQYLQIGCARGTCVLVQYIK